MGSVDLAENTKLRHKVALKILQFGSNTEQNMRARFYLQAELIASSLDQRSLNDLTHLDTVTTL